MRMFDCDRERAINDVLILLRRSEAEKMRDILDELLENDGFIHEHILDTDDINRQITIGCSSATCFCTGRRLARALPTERTGTWRAWER